jgi:hypothetical protein
MPRPRLSVDFEGFNEVMARLKSLEGDVKNVTEKALKETHRIVTANVEEAAQKANYPAHGKYATGRTAASIDRNAVIEWSGTQAKVPVGFNIKKGGLPSIFMMWGTPRYMKSQKIYDAFYGSKTLDEVHKAQQEIFYAEIAKLGG